MIVRPAGRGDEVGISRVRVDTWRSAYREILPADFLAGLSYERSAARWGEIVADSAGVTPGVTHALYVAQDGDGAIMGYAHGGPERTGDPTYGGEVYAIYVHPRFQGRGAGRALFVNVAEWLKETGYGSLYVWALTQNPHRGFYDRLGGVVANQRRIKVAGLTLDEVAYGWDDAAFARLLGGGA